MRIGTTYRRVSRAQHVSGAPYIFSVLNISTFINIYIYIYHIQTNGGLLFFERGVYVMGRRIRLPGAEKW